MGRVNELPQLTGPRALVAKVYDLFIPRDHRHNARPGRFSPVLEVLQKSS